MPSYRLGDDIDDYCVRCKRIMNHLVVSVMNAEPAKVRCRTCHSDHDYRREQIPPSKADLRKLALFNEVLKTVDPAAEPDLGEPQAAPEPGEPEAKPPAETAPPKARKAARK